MFYRLKDKNEKELKTALKDSKGRPTVILWKDPKTLNVKSTNYIEDIVRKRVFRTERDTVELFFKLYSTLQTDREARDGIEFRKDHIACIKLLSVDVLMTMSILTLKVKFLKVWSLRGHILAAKLAQFFYGWAQIGF